MSKRDLTPHAHAVLQMIAGGPCAAGVVIEQVQRDVAFVSRLQVKWAIRRLQIAGLLRVQEAPQDEYNMLEITYAGKCRLNPAIYA